MKILYIHQYFNTPNMPGSTRSYEFAKKLVQDGNTVFMVTSNWQGLSEKKITIEDGIKVFWLNIRYSNKMGYFRRIISFLRFFFYSIKIGLSLDYEIILASSTPLSVGLSGIILKKIKKTKLIFEVRDLWPQIPIELNVIKSSYLVWILKKIEKSIYVNSDKIIALSSGMKTEILKVVSNQKKIKVITNLCDVNKFYIKRSHDNKFRKDILKIEDQPLIIYAGSFGRINNVEYLIDIAINSLSYKKKINFLLAGDGYQKTIIENKARKYKVLNERVFIFDYFKKNELPQILSSATILTSLFIDLPQMQNNSANKFFDALAAAKPLMINYGGWQSDLIKKNKAGFLIPNNEPTRAMSLIYETIFDKDKISLMSKASRELSFNYTVDVNYKKLDKLIKSVF